MNLLHNIKNSIDFFIREKMRFSRKGFYLENEPKDDIFDDFEEKEKIIELESKYLTKYKLEDLKNHSTQYNYLENLYTIELLEKYLTPFNCHSGIDSKSQDSRIDILDIGSKNWAYATGQHHFFKYNNEAKNLSLTGIEIDAFRVYTSFYSRYDSAMFNIKNLENTQYIAGNFLKIDKKFDYICNFLPFIVKEPLMYWGLPMSNFKPFEITQHSYDCLKTNGTLLIMNQGKEEYKAQHDVLEKLELPYEAKGIFKSNFIQYKHDRYITIIKKQDA